MKGKSIKKSKRMLKLVVLFIIISLFVTVSITSALAEETTITIWCWEYQQNCINSILDKFYELYPEIKIKFEVMGSGDICDKMLLVISAGEGAPDVAGFQNERLAQFVALEALHDITEKALPYFTKMDSTKWIDAMDKEKRIYAMPSDSAPAAIFYRRDIFEKAGLVSDPESVAKLLDTWDDFYEVAKIIKEKTGSYMIPLSKTDSGFGYYGLLIWQRGLGFVDREGKVIIDSPKALNTLEYLGKFWKEDLAQDVNEWTAGWYAGIDEGKVATIIKGAWMGGFLWTWITPETSGKWGVVPLPVWEKGGVRSSNDGGSVYAITKQSKNKEAAWKFIEYITTNKEAMLTAWKEMDSLPSLLECYTESSIVEEEVAFFGGQKYRKIFVEAVKYIPWFNYTKDFGEMENILARYVSAYALGKITSAEEALTQAAEEIRMRTGRK